MEEIDRPYLKFRCCALCRIDLRSAGAVAAGLLPLLSFIPIARVLVQRGDASFSQHVLPLSRSLQAVPKAQNVSRHHKQTLSVSLVQQEFS